MIRFSTTFQPIADALQSLTVASVNETHTIKSGGRRVSVQPDERHLNTANFLQEVGADFTLKVNGNITLDASGNVTIRGARVIINYALSFNSGDILLNSVG